MRATVHTTMHAVSTQLMFRCNALLNVSFEVDWQYIKERKQKLILQNNKRENATRFIHQYQVGDRVMVKLDPNRKHGSDCYAGPQLTPLLKFLTMAQSSSPRSPLTAELSARHGTSGI